jgi:3-oxoacyl-[acyl-carrier-protein] synthase II
MKRRVVISGVGAVSGFGVGVAALWEGLGGATVGSAGSTCIAKPTRLDLSAFPCQLAGEVRDFSAKDFVPKSYRKAVKVMARDTEIAVALAHEAFGDARVLTRGSEAVASGTAPTFASERMGCQIGAGLISAETHELTSALVTSIDDRPENARRGGFSYEKWGTIGPDNQSRSGGMDNLQPLWMLKYLPNMLACHVTIIHGCEGPSNTITCAEASGLLCIGESARVIERDAADVAISGSAESKLSLMGVLRMSLAGRFGSIPADADPLDAVTPYVIDAKGSVPGEGGGLLVLEEMQSARRRGVTAYAEVAGFGAGHSLGQTTPGIATTEPDAVNTGLVRAIKAALADAGVKREQIDLIVPQACGAPCMDGPEAGALREVFGAALDTIELATLPPALGDCAAGTGGLQAAVAALAIRHQTLPARVGKGRSAVVHGLRAGPAPSRAMPIKNVLVCTSSLGGQNAAVVLRRVDE